MKQRMSVRVLALLIGMSVCGFSGNVLAQDAAMKVGFVDLQKVIDSSEEGKRAQEQMKQKAAQLEEEAKKMQTEFETAKADYEKQLSSDMLTPEAKSEKRDEISRMERDYTRFVRDSQSELRMMEQRSLKQLLENVGKIVVEYGKNNNFTLILEAGNILYGSEQIEITNDIITLYNSREKK